MRELFDILQIYINTFEKYLNTKLNNVGADEEVDAVEVFDHLKKSNLFEGNIKSLSDLENTVIGKLINKKIDQHNDRTTNTLKAYSIWVAVIYWQKETVQQNIAHTQREMRISSPKSKPEFTREFVEKSAAEWMEKNWPSDVDFLGLDDENFNQPHTVTLLKTLIYLICLYIVLNMM